MTDTSAQPTATDAATRPSAPFSEQLPDPDPAESDVQVPEATSPEATSPDGDSSEATSPEGDSPEGDSPEVTAPAGIDGVTSDDDADDTQAPDGPGGSPPAHDRADAGPDAGDAPSAEVVSGLVSDEPASDELASAEGVSAELASGQFASGQAVSDEAHSEGEPAGGTSRRGSRVRLLEREGEIAADFLERLLDIADLDGDIEVDIDGDRAAVSIVDSEDGRVPRRLVGQDAKVLDAIQELTRLAVQKETGERSRLMLDVAGYRAERRRALVELARVAITEVKTSGSRRSLENMTAFERKIIHDEVAAAGLDSESEGVEPNRHIVIMPA